MGLPEHKKPNFGFIYGVLESLQFHEIFNIKNFVKFMWNCNMKLFFENSVKLIHVAISRNFYIPGVSTIVSVKFTPDSFNSTLCVSMSMVFLSRWDGPGCSRIRKI